MGMHNLDEKGMMQVKVMVILLTQRKVPLNLKRQKKLFL